MTESGGPKGNGEPEALLLSICIPTYNRAGLLKVMLEALLPQAAKARSQVEVIVSDNASTDATATVVEEARQLGPVSYARNPTNLGPILNFIAGPVSLARGKYVWVLGDHNLLAPDALDKIINALESHLDLDVFYINFRCARYPDDWPESALNGYSGPHSYLANTDLLDHGVERWRELVHGGPNALCTQIYAHIVRREVWLEYWKNRRLGDPFTSGITTFPHTFMLADKVFDHPAWYVGDPALTIFNGAQSWGAPAVKARVFFRGLPELIDHFVARGLQGTQLNEARAFACFMAYDTGMGFFVNSGPSRLGTALALLGPKGTVRHAYLLPSIWRAFVDAGGGRVSRAMGASQRGLQATALYAFYLCRPARWARQRMKR